MTEDSSVDRRSLAFEMLTKLPRFGNWAESMREFETPYGTIGYRQAAILWYIRYQLLPPTELTPTGFATAFRVQPSVITRALTKLEQHGFITRSIDPQDTRVSHIAMTESGAAISIYIEQLYVDDLLDAMSGIPDEQLPELERSLVLLDQIAVRLEQRRESRMRRGRPSTTPE
jgi:DNA-binding MarR family transcriptional regulator